TARDRETEAPPSRTRHSANPTAPGVVPDADLELSRPTRPTLSGPRLAIELIWYDEAAARAVRNRFHIASGAPASEAGDDRRDLIRILMRAAPLGIDALQAAILNAVDELGSFSPPLVLVAGMLRFAFDTERGEQPVDSASEPALVEQRKYPRKLL